MKPLHLEHVSDPDITASQLIASLRAKGKERLADAAARLWVALRRHRGTATRDP